MRVVFYKQYAVYYRPGDSIVFIVRVIHGARDVAVIGERGGFDVD
jgi:toxin ParE1/3/4